MYQFMTSEILAAQIIRLYAVDYIRRKRRHVTGEQEQMTNPQES